LFHLLFSPKSFNNTASDWWASYGADTLKSLGHRSAFSGKLWPLRIAAIQSN